MHDLSSKSNRMYAVKYLVHQTPVKYLIHETRTQTRQGDASDPSDANMNGLLRRKKKKSTSGLRKSKLSRSSFANHHSASVDDTDFGGSNSKRSSAEIGKSVSFDEEAEDQVFDRPEVREGESRPGSVHDDGDDTLSVISESFTNEGTVCGLNHEHLSIKIIDEVFQIDIERMFELLFTDCPFQDELAKRRKIFDVVPTPWVESTDGDYLKARTLSYTVPINISFCPKRAESVEKQTMDITSKPGRRYIIDTEADTTGIPYGDAFSFLNRFCITRITRRSCRLNVTGHVKYRKNVMALIKNLVYKTCVSGITNNFGILCELLRNEEAKLTGQVRPQTAGSEESGSSPSTPGDRYRPDGAFTSKALGEGDDPHYSNGVAGKSPSNNHSKHLTGTYSGNQSVLSTPVSGFLLVVASIFIVLMCVNISLMVMLCTMDLPDLASYANLANPASRTQQTEKFSMQESTSRSEAPSSGGEPLQDLLTHITSLREDLKSDLTRYEAHRKLATTLPSADHQDSNDSCDGEKYACKGRGDSVDPTLREIVSLQSELHAAHLSRLYNTLSATTDLMRIVQQSLQDLLKAGVPTSVEADTGAGIKTQTSQNA